MSRCAWCEVELPMRDSGYNPTRRRYCSASHKQLAYIDRKKKTAEPPTPPRPRSLHMSLATIVDGKTDLADLLFLLAVIFSVVVAFIRRASVDAVLMAVAVGCIAAALLVL